MVRLSSDSEFGTVGIFAHQPRDLVTFGYVFLKCFTARAPLLRASAIYRYVQVVHELYYI